MPLERLSDGRFRIWLSVRGTRGQKEADEYTIWVTKIFYKIKPLSFTLSMDKGGSGFYLSLQ